MRSKAFFFIMTATAIFILSCGNSNDKNGEQEDIMKENSGSKVNVPVFNEDSAYVYVKAQTDFGPRVPNTPAHDKCARWLEQKMKTYTEHVQVQKSKVRAYNGTLLNMMNIIATFNPDSPARILLCAHWDSRPYADWDEDPINHNTPIDGANDGASGVGVLTEVARVLSLNDINLGVDIIFFDVEDYGEPRDERNNNTDENWGLGSQYWSKNPHEQNYKALYGILLDMVGVESATFTKEGFSMEYAPDIVNKVWNAASRIGYGNFFVNEPTNPVTDDHYFINKITGIPTIDIIHFDKNTSTGFYKYWHTKKDNIETINKNTLKAVGQTLLTVLYEENAGSLTQE